MCAVLRVKVVWVDGQNRQSFVSNGNSSESESGSDPVSDSSSESEASELELEIWIFSIRLAIRARFCTSSSPSASACRSEADNFKRCAWLLRWFWYDLGVSYDFWHVEHESSWL